MADPLLGANPHLFNRHRNVDSGCPSVNVQGRIAKGHSRLSIYTEVPPGHKFYVKSERRVEGAGRKVRCLGEGAQGKQGNAASCQPGAEQVLSR